MDVVDELECMRTTARNEYGRRKGSPNEGIGLGPEYIGRLLVSCYMLQLRDVLFVSVLPSTPW